VAGGGGEERGREGGREGGRERERFRGEKAYLIAQADAIASFAMAITLVSKFVSGACA